MRGSAHSHHFCTFDITASGAVVGGPLRNYQGITTGTPKRDSRSGSTTIYPGLTEKEGDVLDMLVRLGSANPAFLAERMGIHALELTQTLMRLEALGYAKVTKEGGDVYRAVAQLGG
jgi:DNA-binding MarR family transcriptional regulator